MPPVTESSAPALLAAIEASNVAYWRTVCDHLPGAEFHDGQELAWFATGVPVSWFNQVMRTQVAPDEIDAKIEETLARFEARGVPMLWSVGPSVRPPELETFLEAHGLTRAGGVLVGMAVNLAALPEARQTPPGFTIERVRDVGALSGWLRGYVDGFGISDVAGQAMFDLHATIGFDDHRPFRHYAGFLDGEPVASSTLFLGAGVAGIYHVGTTLAARRQGIGRAMSLAPLGDARAMGYSVGTLYASDMGFSVYRQMGFQEHCKLVQYRWEPQP